MERSIFATRLLALRKSHHMTQEQVALFLGVNRSTYTCYERDTSTPTLNSLCALADLFEVSADYLLGRSNHEQLIDIAEGYPSPDEIQLTQLYRRLNDRQRRALRELIKTF